MFEYLLHDGTERLHDASNCHEIDVSELLLDESDDPLLAEVDAEAERYSSERHDALKYVLSNRFCICSLHGLPRFAEFQRDCTEHDTAEARSYLRKHHVFPSDSQRTP